MLAKSNLRMQASRIGSCVVGGDSMCDRLGTTILVPLTNSLYVPGKLSDTEHVVVDIGTGYYVKKVIA
jgi:prefoldin alpha subunit